MCRGDYKIFKLMDTLLITGAGPNGVTGRLIKEYFKGKYRILSPGSRELDLTNDIEVANYFSNNHIDYVIHCATFRPYSYSEENFVNEELESNLRMYFSLALQSSKFRKMFYFGSGAEFDKSSEIVNIKEIEFGRSIPKNKYGLGKYIMNCDASKSINIYNFRLFGTINRYERYDKNIISNLCVKAIKKLPFNLRQDCRFSFIDIVDILPAIEHGFHHELRYHDYNIAISKSFLLSEIANIISSFSDNDNPIQFMEKGLNLEYTASNRRFVEEFNPAFTPIEISLKRVFDHYSNICDDINVENIDARWDNSHRI